MWADLRNRRIVFQLDASETRDIGIAVNLGLPATSPLVIVNPQQVDWASTVSVRASLLQFAVAYFRIVERSGVGASGGSE